MSESLQCTLEDVACVSQHRRRLLPPHPWAMTRDSWVLPRQTPRALETVPTELGRWIFPWKNSRNPFPFASQLIISINYLNSLQGHKKPSGLPWLNQHPNQGFFSWRTGANLHQNSLKNYIVFHWFLKFSSNLITTQKMSLLDCWRVRSRRSWCSGSTQSWCRVKWSCAPRLSPPHSNGLRLCGPLPWW
jgi:hypothetical protein